MRVEVLVSSLSYLLVFMGQVHKGVRVRVGVGVRTCVYIHVHVCTYLYVCACVYVPTCVCVCMHGVWLQSGDYYLEYFGFARFSFCHMASGLQRKAFLGLSSVAALFVFHLKLLEQWVLDS